MNLFSFNPAPLALELGKKLKAQHYTLVTAESCTGGGLSYWITSTAGSSEWFERGFVTYSNAAKQELLKVLPATLTKYGAVSKETVGEMAEGALKQSHADLSIAITGIAGPSGETQNKPVGTIWIACANQQRRTDATLFHFSGTRQSIREQTIIAALEKLLQFLSAAI